MSCFFKPTASRARVQSNPVRTRSDLQELLEALLDPLVPYTSAGGARIRIGSTGAHFDEIAADLEGVARCIWGLAPLIAGGGSFRNIGNWVEGLKNGSDPSHPEYWGKTTDRDQRFVEMAAVGFSLALAPKTFWEPLNQKQRDNLSAWLLEINDHELPPQNWRFFKVLVNVGLKMVGAPYSEAAIEEELAFIETFYDPTGWPTDGVKPHTHQTDYYASSFAIPFYSLVYSKLAASWDPKRCEVFRERAKVMSLDVVHLFAEDGNAIPFGRSLTYRFAMSAFWAAAAYADLELPAPLTWGVVKGLVLRNIRSFTQDGDIMMPDGTLTIGYKYPNYFLSESYNSPQSPYWCLKSFLPLALPPSHPFWTSTEESYPPELLVAQHIIRPADQVASHAGGHTFLLTSGQSCSWNIRHGAEKYAKFAYSSAFGFSVPTGASFLDQHAIDSMLGLCDDPLGERWRVRRKAENVEIGEDGVIKSEWYPWPDVQVTTWLVPPDNVNSGYHTRIHRIISKRDLQTAEGSFALLYQAGPEESRRKITRQGEAWGALHDAEEEDGLWFGTGSALAYTPLAGAVGIHDLLSPHSTRVGECVIADPNTNLMVSRTTIPTLRGSVRGDGKEVWYASAVFGVPMKCGRQDWLNMWEDRPSLPSWVKIG